MKAWAVAGHDQILIQMMQRVNWNCCVVGTEATVYILTGLGFHGSKSQRNRKLLFFVFFFDFTVVYLWTR